jgi:hypothetical protein
MDRLIDSAQLDGWIPARLFWSEGQPLVEWCYLGRETFSDSFFDQTIGECLRHPFNLLFSHRTPMEVLGQWYAMQPGLLPTGFIFHMSRCGSTLVSRTLAALRQNIVVSEARPVDATLRASHRVELSEQQRSDWLRWMISALAQPRGGGEKHFFIKFDAWNALEFSLIRKTFPTVPWIFVYRDPIEVMVSQFNNRGAQTVPGVIDSEYFGIARASVPAMEAEEYCARVLAAICGAGLQHQAGGGMLINYRELPEGIWTSISEHFGVAWANAEKETMKLATNVHAKNLSLLDGRDSIRKQGHASERIREATAKWLLPVYERLEAARHEQLPWSTPKSI